ncbi:2987_t:CDS:2, partial [Funneliformis caledonium]
SVMVHSREINDVVPEVQCESSKNQAQDLSKVNISSASKVALEV